jgi:hypothetical protein
MASGLLNSCVAKFRVDFTGLPAGTNTPYGYVSFRLINESTNIDPDLSYNFKWYISQLPNSEITSPISSFIPVFTVKISDFPIQVNLSISGSCSSFTQNKVFMCSSNFSTSMINGTQFLFTPTPLSGPNAIYSWSFGDGTTFSSSNVVQGQHIYSNSFFDDYYVSLTVTNPVTSCTSITVRSIIAGCGKRNAENISFEVIGNRKMESDISFYKDPCMGQTVVSAYTIFYKKNALGYWKNKKADSITSTLSGWYFPNCSGAIARLFLTPSGIPSLNGALTLLDAKKSIIKANNISGLDVTFENGQIYSTHTITDGDVTFPSKTQYLF